MWRTTSVLFILKANDYYMYIQKKFHPEVWAGEGLGWAGAPWVKQNNYCSGNCKLFWAEAKNEKKFFYLLQEKWNPFNPVNWSAWKLGFFTNNYSVEWVNQSNSEWKSISSFSSLIACYFVRLYKQFFGRWQTIFMTKIAQPPAP